MRVKIAEKPTLLGRRLEHRNWRKLERKTCKLMRVSFSVILKIRYFFLLLLGLQLLAICDLCYSFFAAFLFNKSSYRVKGVLIFIKSRAAHVVALSCERTAWSRPARGTLSRQQDVQVGWRPIN